MTRVTLKLDQDAAIGATDLGAFSRSTLRYIPGQVLRGAYAAAWIRGSGAPTATNLLRDEFVRLFEGGVRFGPLFADGAPQPLSILRHKNAGQPKCRRSAWDLAVEAGPGERECPECQDPLENAKGEIKARTRRSTHVQLSDGETAVKGQLFAREVISATAQREFVGELDGPDDLVGVLERLGPLRIGGRRTTSGRATIRLEKADRAGVPQLLPDGRIVIRLASPGVFVDDLGAPRPAPSAAELESILETPVAVERSWVRWTVVGGWHAASGLPKPSEHAAAPGSTYVVRPDTSVGPSQLEALARRGLGLRRHEGLGALAPPPLDLQMIETLFQVSSSLRRAIAAELAERAERMRRGDRPPPGTCDRLVTHPATPAAIAEAVRSLLKIADPVLLGRHVAHLRSKDGRP